jgi:hypothetical protein
MNLSTIYNTNKLLIDTNKTLIDKMLLNVLISILSGFATIALVVVLAEHTYCLTAALIALLLFLHFLQPQSIFLYIFCGLGGSLTESAAMSLNAHTWCYFKPTKPFNFPIWLSIVWALAATLIVTLNALIGQFNELNANKNKIE